MSTDGRAERVAAAMGSLDEVWRAAFEISKDPDPARRDEAADDIGRRLAQRLIAAGVTPEDLATADVLRWQTREAFHPLERERAAKLVYLATHAPEVPIGEAIASLTPEQREEYDAITAEDL